jgi:hypothetical protein
MMRDETAFTVPGWPGDGPRGEKPPGPGYDLGHFGSLAGASLEAVADTVVGRALGSTAAEKVARDRLRWVWGVPVGDNARLMAAAAGFMHSGLCGVRVDNGCRHWQRVSEKARPTRSINLPPEPTGREPAATGDSGTDRLKALELRDLDKRIRSVVREELRAHGVGAL